jgi:HD-like signal output (HDOD) protein
MSDPVLPEDSTAPTTTAEQNLSTAGQRHINVMWERTQQIIAVSVTTIVLGAAVYVVVMGAPEDRRVAFALLSNIGMLVIATYFQRTNHTKTGGTGERPSDITR